MWGIWTHTPYVVICDFGKFIFQFCWKANIHILQDNNWKLKKIAATGVNCEEIWLIHKDKDTSWKKCEDFAPGNFYLEPDISNTGQTWHQVIMPIASTFSLMAWFMQGFFLGMTSISDFDVELPWQPMRNSPGYYSSNLRASKEMEVFLCTLNHQDSAAVAFMSISMTYLSISVKEIN